MSQLWAMQCTSKLGRMEKPLNLMSPSPKEPLICSGGLGRSGDRDFAPCLMPSGAWHTELPRLLGQECLSLLLSARTEDHIIEGAGAVCYSGRESAAQLGVSRSGGKQLGFPLIVSQESSGLPIEAAIGGAVLAEGLGRIMDCFFPSHQLSPPIPPCIGFIGFGRW